MRNPGRTVRIVILLATFVLAVISRVAAGPIGAEFKVGGAPPEISPSVAINEDGTSLAVWSADDQGNRTIRGRAFDSSGQPIGSEFQVNASNAGSHYGPSAVALPNGGFIVIWDSPNIDHYEIFWRRLDASATPIGGEVQ